MKGALPRGFRDILPTEARELHAIERTLMNAFAQYGYVPLEPPTVEFAESAVTVDERRTVRLAGCGQRERHSSNPKALRITSTGAAIPVHSSNDAAPCATSTSSPEITAAPPSRAARPVAVSG